MMMEHNLNYEGSDGSQRVYSNIGYEPCTENIAENNLQISHSNQHVNLENSKDFCTQQLVFENSSNFINNNDVNTHVYESVSLANTYLDPRESSSLPVLRRNSMRGRRRYRRTLLRNYEQPLGQSSQINHLYLEKCDDNISNIQRRVYLRSPNIVGGGMNYSSFKFNNNFDNYSKTSKPSWDGGRLVKLLQGHGLNIDNYENESEYVSDKCWNSKQVNTQNNTIFGHHNNNEENVSTALNDQKYIQLNSVNQGSDVKESENLNKQTILSTMTFQNTPLSTIQQNDSFGIYSQNNVLLHEVTPLNHINNVEKQMLLQGHSIEGNETILNGNNDKSIIGRLSLVSSDSQILMGYNKNIEDSGNLIYATDQKYSTSNSYGNSNESNCDPERKNSITSTFPNIEKQVINIEGQHMFNMEEHEVEQGSEITNHSFNPSFYNISQEELFVTLGDTPTSKSNYNISTLFVPNQDS